MGVASLSPDVSGEVNAMPPSSGESSGVGVGETASGNAAPRSPHTELGDSVRPAFARFQASGSPLRSLMGSGA
ncbi:MAG TPA: hypothetical protein VE975_07000, partial [Actinomycetota bacterium]|nr:hypothetical protein [Actinomycetota bacterium]